MKAFRVSSLFCSGAAQVFHVLRVVELKEQLEVEEEDGDRQEEEEEVEREKSSQRVAPMNMTVGDNECAQNLSQEVCGVITNRMNWCNFLQGNPCNAIGTFYHWDFFLWDFGFSTHFAHSVA